MEFKTLVNSWLTVNNDGEGHKFSIISLWTRKMGQICVDYPMREDDSQNVI